MSTSLHLAVKQTNNKAISVQERRDLSKSQFLTAENKSHITTYGKKTVTLQFNSMPITWTFVIADLSQPIRR
ncbi:hypothetical protein HZS_835 [Henneguya salminicola]|nr:hypothetical protein HZS_835 [Henneguya salminicola]